MTAPHVQFGNVASDIGQGANSFAQGLLAQRQRQAQIAMQQALTSQTTANTQDIQQQEAQRQHMNEPAGDDQFLQLKHFIPDAKREELDGMSRSEADAYIQRGASAWAMKQMTLEMARARMSQDEESRLRIAYERDSTHPAKALDLYRGALNGYITARAGNDPVGAEGMLLSFARQNMGRINQAELNRINALGGLNSLWQRHVNGEIFGQNPVTKPILDELVNAARGIGHSMYTEYATNRQRYTQLAAGRQIDPNYVVSSDNYSDIPDLETQAGISDQQIQAAHSTQQQQQQAQPYRSPLAGFRTGPTGVGGAGGKF